MSTALVAVGVVAVSRVVVATLSATICSNEGRAKVVVINSVISSVRGIGVAVTIVAVHHSF